MVNFRRKSGRRKSNFKPALLHQFHFAADNNLTAAWRAVQANRGAAGVDGMGIEQTQAHLREHWETVAQKLLVGEYRPAAVRAVEIPKPQGGVRVLGIPNVQDCLIQQAIHHKLSPLWEAEFSEHSYGLRPNRSAHDAI